MEKLKDELDRRTQSYLSLNFLMASFSGEVIENERKVNNLLYSDDAHYSLKPKEKGEGATDHRELYFCALYHKSISRTFDIGKCRKEE